MDKIAKEESQPCPCYKCANLRGYAILAGRVSSDDKEELAKIRALDCLKRLGSK